MKSSITVSLVPEAKGGPFVFWNGLNDACKTAGQLGFDAIEIFAPSPQELLQPDLPQWLGDNNLGLAAVGTGAGWVKHRLHLVQPDKLQRAAAIDFIKSMIDAGAANNAPAIVGSMQGRWDDNVNKDTAIKYLQEGLLLLGEHARQYNLPLIFEPLNRYESNIATCMEDGATIVPETDCNVVLLADLFHLNIEESNIAATIRSFGHRIGHVHFVDSNRRPVGNGHLAMADIVLALRDVGYQGYLSAEALPYPDSYRAAQQTIRAFKYWTASPQV